MASCKTGPGDRVFLFSNGSRPKQILPAHRLTCMKLVELTAMLPPTRLGWSIWRSTTMEEVLGPAGTTVTRLSFRGSHRDQGEGGS